jgi:hypothetical protein
VSDPGQHRSTGTKTPEGDQPAGGVLAQAPTALIVGVTVVFVALLFVLGAIVISGKSTKEFTDSLRLVFGAVSSAAALLATLYGASAAKSAKAAREQTNSNLDARMRMHAEIGTLAALEKAGIRPMAPRPPSKPRRALPPA